jgi:hypothetical protein
MVEFLNLSYGAGSKLSCPCENIVAWHIMGFSAVCNYFFTVSELLLMDLLIFAF